MEAKVRFFKQDNKWYADIPNHTLEENEMVMGADVLLDFLSNGRNEVTVVFSNDKADQSRSYLKLKMKSHDEEGAYYTIYGKCLADFLNYAEDVFCSMYEPEVWICNVTHDMFGEHPEFICILSVG